MYDNLVLETRDLTEDQRNILKAIITGYKFENQVKFTDPVFPPPPSPPKSRYERVLAGESVRDMVFGRNPPDGR